LQVSAENATQRFSQTADDQGYAVAHTTADGTVHVTGVGVHDVASPMSRLSRE